MANKKALVVSDLSKNIDNADTLLVGSGIDVSAVGALAIGAATSTSVVVTPPTTIQGVTVGLGAGAVATNTAVGVSALGGVTTGAANTAVGYFSGGLISTSVNNSYLGYLAGQKLTGPANTGIGYGALGGGTGGAAQDNTAVGSEALGSLTTGVENVAIGKVAAFTLTSGGQNVAVGVNALSNATTNGSNVAVGFSALLVDTLGSNSVAVGFRALDAQNPAAATAMNNVAVGSGAGGTLTTGTANTLLGTNAGDLITTGTNNVVIGNNADVAVNSNTNTVVIGHNAVATGANNITLGNVTTDTFRLGVAATALPNGGVSAQGLAGLSPSLAVGHTSAVTGANFMVFAGGGGTRGLIAGNGAGGVNYLSISDYRLKSDLLPIADALVRLGSLHPCSFHFTGLNAPRVEGFIAHEVQAIVPEAVNGAKDAVDADGSPQYQSLDQGRLVPLLTAACQELAAKADAATARAIEAERRLDALEAAVAALQAG
jgi:hypothetical protein